MVLFGPFFLKSVHLFCTRSHNDLPMKMKRNANNLLQTFDLNETPPWDPTHTDIPRLKEGLVGAQVGLTFLFSIILCSNICFINIISIATMIYHGNLRII